MGILELLILSYDLVTVELQMFTFTYIFNFLTSGHDIMESSCKMVSEGRLICTHTVNIMSDGCYRTS